MERQARLNGLEPALVMAIIWQESRFDHRARNDFETHGGSALGLMQVQLATGRMALNQPALTEAQLMIPETNVAAGTRYLRDQLRRYNGRYPEAIAAYNAGTVLRHNGKFVNQYYVNRVLDRLAHYRAILEPGL